MKYLRKYPPLLSAVVGLALLLVAICRPWARVIVLVEPSATVKIRIPVELHISLFGIKAEKYGLHLDEEGADSDSVKELSTTLRPARVHINQSAISKQCAPFYVAARIALVFLLLSAFVSIWSGTKNIAGFEQMERSHSYRDQNALSLLSSLLCASALTAYASCTCAHLGGGNYESGFWIIFGCGSFQTMCTAVSVAARDESQEYAPINDDEESKHSFAKKIFGWLQDL